MPADEEQDRLDASLVGNFLTRYYAVLEDKPEAWLSMVEGLRAQDKLELLPL